MDALSELHINIDELSCVKNKTTKKVDLFKSEEA